MLAKNVKIAAILWMSVMMLQPLSAQQRGERRQGNARPATELTPEEKAAKAAEAKRKSDESLDKKAAEWTASLQLNDAAKEARVSAVIATHLKAIRDWHNDHLNLIPAGSINPLTGKELSALDREIIADSGLPAAVKQALMDGLRADLTEDQVEAILDKYTIGKVAFTLEGYRSIVPNMTAEDEAYLLANLKEARGIAVHFKNMKAISGIFEIYKTKNEQYFTNTGRDWKIMYKAYTDKRKAEKAAAAAAQK